MEDTTIIDLYLQRDETALELTSEKYGAFCQRIALNILTLREDAEECVNDTWNTAWNRIRPVIPTSLRAFLGRITRDISISRWRKNRARKRYAGMVTMLSELSDCVPDSRSTEEMIDLRILSEAINRWLESLSADDRTLFLRRYWFGDSVKSLAKESGCTENRMAKRMQRLRQNLKAILETEELP